MITARITELRMQLSNLRPFSDEWNRINDQLCRLMHQARTGR